MTPRIHAVTVKFNTPKGYWVLLDSNQEGKMRLSNKQVVDNLIDTAYSVRVIEWCMVQSSTNPDEKYGKRISYNLLRGYL